MTHFILLNLTLILLNKSDTIVELYSTILFFDSPHLKIKLIGDMNS